jgi:penicillin-binding protein 2
MSNARLKDHWTEQRLFISRCVVAAGVVAALTLLVVGRLVQLQVVQYDVYSAQSQGNRIRLLPVVPTRGLILDRNGTVLAENTPSFALEVTPEQATALPAELRRLAEIGLLDPEELPDIRREIASHKRFEAVTLRERLSDDEVAAFAVRRPYFPGFDIKAQLSRRYPYGQIAAHALGYVGGMSVADLQAVDEAQYAGTTHIGKVSVERSYEEELHGNTGEEQVLVNARGRNLETISRDVPAPGEDLVLALDLPAQKVAYEALADKRGAVVGIDPRNGEIIVFVSTPAFDPNTMAGGISRKAYVALEQDIDRPLFNRAIRGLYPPGSTIKPIIALAALHHGTTDPRRPVYCSGAFMLPGSTHRYRDWKKEGHGSVDMHSGIEQSCDVYFYNVARDLGIERLQAFLKDFGLGAVTGIDMPGEKDGLVPSPEWKRRSYPKAGVWYPGETLITGIGQGYLQVSPIQLANAAATIAARGKRFQPQLVHALRDPITGKIEPVEPRPLEPVPLTDKAYWDIVVDGMYAVMNGPRGTARAVGQGALLHMAGKSGTAQVFTVAQTAKYNAAQVDERLRDHALFIAFGPVEDPKIAVAVVVENGESGSKAAAPIARKVMEAYLRLAPAT